MQGLEVRFAGVDELARSRVELFQNVLVTGARKAEREQAFKVRAIKIGSRRRRVESKQEKQEKKQ